jgi:hypothetical protein
LRVKLVKLFGRPVYWTVFAYHICYFRRRAKEACVNLHTTYRMKTDFHVCCGDLTRRDNH